MKQKQEEEGEDEFCMRFSVFGVTVCSVFGVTVCREAFMRMAGIHADTLQRARSAAVAGTLHHSEAMSAHTLAFTRAIQSI